MLRFVFPPVQARRGDRPWTYAALSAQLTAAEMRADIPHVAFRGMHGFRRGAAKNVLELTGGDLNKAGEWIGDTDLRALKRSYLKAGQRSYARWPIACGCRPRSRTIRGNGNRMANSLTVKSRIASQQSTNK
jgi:hypothetical protein